MALNILIVDDSPVMRSFIRRVVGLTGLDIGEICEAGHGREALAVLGVRWMDLVLTDINMPDMNGEELLRHMEQDELLRTVPVIVVSTDASVNRVQKMMALGARGYVTKPFAPDSLAAEMERALEVTHA
ncbi:MAG: response regulator [Bryobacteraceae bacterium]|nr:response regulator [Bryobacteraceae bacterium]